MSLTPGPARSPLARLAGALGRGLRVLFSLAIVVAAVLLVIALWNVYEVSPWTRDGRVQADVVTVAPEVAGTIVAVPVHDNQLVHKGDVLFTIDPERFQIALEQAQANYDGAQLQLQLRQSDAKRRAGLNGVVSAEEQERFRNQADVASTSLGTAKAALDLAKLNLKRATIYAPVNGYVSHLRLRVGDYAAAGQARMAVVDSDSFWVDGYFEETKFQQIRIDEPASIKLMGYDARLTGHVDSFIRGINNANDTINSQGLPNVNPVFTWVRLAQRIPVHVHIDSVPAGVELVAGMTCSITLGDQAAANGPDANGMGARGRLISWLQDHL